MQIAMFPMEILHCKGTGNFQNIKFPKPVEQLHFRNIYQYGWYNNQVI